MKKVIQIIIYPVLIISLMANAFFIFNIYQDRPIVKVEGKTILTQNELNSVLVDNYKVSMVNQKVSDYLLQLEIEDRSVKAPTDEDLKELTVLFPSFVGYSTDIDKNREILNEAYYVYQIFKEDGVDVTQIKKFLTDRYGNANTNIYEICLYETTDHEYASEVETMLKEGQSIKEIEELLDIEFFTSYTVSMDSLIHEDKSNNTTDHNEESMETMNTVTDTTTYEAGDVYHIMDAGMMEVILINDILSIDNNLDHFKNLYFAQNYTSIKNSIVNGLKSKYVVSYY